MRDARTATSWAAVSGMPARYQTSSWEKLRTKVANSERASAQNTTMTAAWAEVPRSLRSQ